MNRRREMAEFLRMRREKIQPAEVGLSAPSARRRTPGLRREEVAELAGVGATWYTWLEQARDIQPSEDVLQRLAEALRLTSAEREHLFALAGKTPPRFASHLEEEIVPPDLQSFIKSAFNVPAILLGKRWDILEVNELAKSTFKGFADFSDFPNKKLNLLEIIFCSPLTRTELEDWELNAKRVLAEFRLSLSDSMEDPKVQELIENIKTRSPQFNQWWNEHEVRDFSSVLLNRRDGELQRFVFTPASSPHLRLLVYSRSMRT